jgi:6-phosphofructokinase 2
MAAFTRENLTVAERATTSQYRFVLPGPKLDREEWERCLDRLTALEPRPRYVVASGSLPPGVPNRFYERLAAISEQLGARTVLDTSGSAARTGSTRDFCRSWRGRSFIARYQGSDERRAARCPTTRPEGKR